MEYKEYPKGLRDILKGMNCEKDKIGKSSSKVLRYYDDKKSYYLKVESNYEIKREAEIMDWLKGRLPVPEKVYFESSGEYHYLLMTELKGLMLSSDYYLNRPEETVKLLAEGIRMLQSLPIDNCPFDARLEKKLKLAEDNIINGLVDTSTWEEDNNFSSPEELLEYLKNKKPKNTTLSFTHGDYTLSNIFAKDGKVIGFIDLGRGGVGDIYQDIALAVRSLKHKFTTDAYIDLFFRYLDMEADLQRINYYILLDELF